MDTDPDAPPNRGALQVARFVAAALGCAAAGGLTAGLTSTASILAMCEVKPKDRAHLLQAFFLSSALEWVPVGLAFAALWAFIPSSASTRARLGLWLGAFLPAALLGRFVCSAWASLLLQRGCHTTPWDTIEWLVDRSRYWNHWMVLVLGHQLLAQHLPLAAAGLLATERVRWQVAALALVAALGVVLGIALDSLGGWWSLRYMYPELLVPLVPLAALAGALGLARLTVPSR